MDEDNVQTAKTPAQARSPGALMVDVGEALAALSTTVGAIATGGPLATPVGVTAAAGGIVSILGQLNNYRARQRAKRTIAEVVEQVQHLRQDFDWAAMVTDERLDQMVALLRQVEDPKASAEEQRRLLSNALASQLLEPADQVCFALFHRALERVTALHVKVLEFVAAHSRSDWQRATAISEKARPLEHLCRAEDVRSAFNRYAPDLLSAIVADLGSLGLVTDDSSGRYSVPGAYSLIFASALGRDFLLWVTEPAQWVEKE